MGALYMGRRGRPGRARDPFQKRDPFHEDSKYVLGFEIGQGESGFHSERTESQRDRQSDRAIQYRISICIFSVEYELLSDN